MQSVPRRREPAKGQLRTAGMQICDSSSYRFLFDKKRLQVCFVFFCKHAIYVASQRGFMWAEASHENHTACVLQAKASKNKRVRAREAREREAAERKAAEAKEK